MFCLLYYLINFWFLSYMLCNSDYKRKRNIDATLPLLKNITDKFKFFIFYFQTIGGICVYFLRTIDKAVTDANIAQGLNFGILDCTKGEMLHGFGEHMSKIILHSLKSLEVSKTGNCLRNNLISCILTNKIFYSPFTFFFFLN